MKIGLPNLMTLFDNPRGPDGVMAGTCEMVRIGDAGDPAHVTAHNARAIRVPGLDFYNTVFQSGDLPVAQARRSLERLGAQVLPRLCSAVPGIFGNDGP